MSLDVYLIVPGAQVPCGTGIFVRSNGSTRELTRLEWDTLNPDREPQVVPTDNTTDVVFEGNVTGNLGRMARAAGVYQVCWKPEELKVQRAEDLIPALREGLERLRADPAAFQQYNPPNGWGSYEVLVAFLQSYLIACIEWPHAELRISR